MNTETKRTPDITADTYGPTLTLTFRDGRELVVNTSRLSPQIALDAMLHGLKQKLVDAAAIARNTDTGRTATLGDKFDAVNEVFLRITSPDGTWNKGRTAGDGAGAQGALFVRALMRIKGKTKAEIDAMLEPLTKEQRAALKKNPRIIEAMRQIELEAAQSADTSSSDDLLDSLGEVDDTPTDDVDDEDAPL
jgi:frataxin-like iron-binding protein CyaY